jgi:hypothetical protein
MNVNFIYDYDGNRFSPLELALRSEADIEIFRLLFQAGADPNFQHDGEITPLTLGLGFEGDQIFNMVEIQIFRIVTVKRHIAF